MWYWIVLFAKINLLAVASLQVISDIGVPGTALRWNLNALRFWRKFRKDRLFSSHKEFDSKKVLPLNVFGDYTAICCVVLS